MGLDDGLTAVVGTIVVDHDVVGYSFVMTKEIGKHQGLVPAHRVEVDLHCVLACSSRQIRSPSQRAPMMPSAGTATTKIRKDKDNGARGRARVGGSLAPVGWVAVDIS